MLGWEFAVGSTLTVQQLGWQDFGDDGLAAEHRVGIWDKNTETLLVDAIVLSGTAATLSDHFRWVTPTSTLILNPGTTYIIGGYDPGSSDAHVWDVFLSGYAGYEVNGFAVSPDVTLGASGTARGVAVATFTFPTLTTGGSRSALIGPNFSYTTAETPDPATLVPAAIALGALCTRLRLRKRSA